MRDPDAGPDLDLQIVELKRRAQRLADALDQQVDRLRAEQLGEEDDELVAAEARDRVALAHSSLQPRADEPKQEIAVVGSERVVDLLEAVEVHQHHRERSGIAGLTLAR